jgi:hypothetical protein
MHLTYHDRDRYASEASPAKAEEAGAPEIEITDDMIAAGVKACELWDSGDPPEWKAWSIYSAMERARRQTTEVQKLHGAVEAAKETSR